MNGLQKEYRGKFLMTLEQGKTIKYERTLEKN